MRQDRQKWAYKTEIIVNRNRLKDVLRDLGEEGWRLVAIDWHPPAGAAEIILERPFLIVDTKKT